MDPLLVKLNDLIGNNILLGVSEPDIVFLRDELSTINALLGKLEEDSDELDAQVKDWRNQVREIAYDIEDCLDDFMHYMGGTDAKAGLIHKFFHFVKTLRARLETAKQIKELKTRLQEINERHKRYKHNVSSSICSSVAIDPRICALYNQSANLVGIEGPREELVKLLTDMEQQLKILSIVGFGGLGKTTLAKEVYQVIGEQFSCKVFVSVSQRPDMTRLLDRIQSKLCIRGCSEELQDIIDNIRTYLKDRRYLIVVDDLWDASSWDIISSVFPENGKGSRVIVTTRVEHVASRTSCNNHLCIYRMRPLNSQDSMKLLSKRIFGSEDGCPPRYREVSAEILKKCGGLPLAIITISSLLANQPARLREDWESIRNSTGTQFGANQTLEGMRQILYLSFKNLPSHLRTCFLYLAIYPEDHVIARDDLIRQWIAEGFVSHSHGRDLEDVAKSNFNELINRSLIQPEKTELGEVFSCRVHDMMLDLILSRCADDNFIRVTYSPEEISRQHDHKVRRLSLDFRIGGAAAGTTSLIMDNSLSQVRSLALFARSVCMPASLLFSKYLRVLVFEFQNASSRGKIKVDLTPIGQLFQLRYLKVAGDATAIIELPTEIQGLQCLETLELHSIHIRSMPSDIVRLPCLKHLIVPWFTTLADGIGKMKSLRTLRSIDMSDTTNIKATRELTNLRSLRVYYLLVPADTAIDALIASLGELRDLRYFDVRGSMYNDEANRLGSLSRPPLRLERLKIGRWQLPRIPRWICSDLQNLRRLNLLVKETSTDEVSVLAELPSLIVLYLYVVDQPKDESAIIFGKGFQALEQLYFCCTRDTPSYMHFLPGVLPKLRHLEIYFDEWEWSGATPAGMEHLLSLQCIEAYMNFYCYGEGGHSPPYKRKTADSLAGCAFMNATQAHPSHPDFILHYIPLPEGSPPPFSIW
ncbi:unnamed protein product [Urochloa decumbens]|uniref:Uncharacterized protein n=2 Tax=Urochloa decumbens TaxID=240449 RepID=A0ABC9EZP0_9POAL